MSTNAKSGTAKGLQADLNYFADKVGFDHVKVDGVIGERTQLALKAVYDAVLAKNAMLQATFVVPATVEDVVKNAEGARVWLDGVARTTLAIGDQRRYHQGTGKDWNTKDSIAYGAGAVHEDFKGLQSDLNRFAGAVGFAPLTVDGFLGPKTAQAVTAVFEAAKAKSSAFEITPFPVPDTKEEVAEYAQFIRAWLANVASQKLILEA